MPHIIYWNIDPEITRIGPIAIRYYSLLFVFGLFASYRVLIWIYKNERMPVHQVERMALYAVIGVVAGARLGHCLFYEFGYYSSHLLEIVLPVRSIPGNGYEFTGYQGLASHGGAAGLIISLILFAWKNKIDVMRLLDRVSVAAPLTAASVRFGNLMNSEIIGAPTNLSFAFVFQRVDNIPRHPSQLYEAAAYLIIFILMLLLYRGKKLSAVKGEMFGFFLTALFSVRFLIEFAKEPQEEFQHNMILNVGQMLSIPFIAAGILLLTRRFYSKEKHEKT